MCGCWIHSVDYRQYELCDASVYPRARMISQVWGLVKNIDIGIYSDTIHVMLDLTRWYYSLSFTHPLLFQWLWPYFKVTTVSNTETLLSENFIFYDQIKLKCCRIVKYVNQIRLFLVFFKDCAYSRKMIGIFPYMIFFMLAFSRILLK